ncbi:MAG: GNAT family N-acetyltransferase [Planctomycetota bacterium]
MNAPDAPLQAIRESDLAEVLAVNEANQPEVGPLDAARLEALWRGAAWAPCVRGSSVRGSSVRGRAGDLVGFALLLREGADYASPNYRWFAERHERFLYVDRIAFLPAARGLGLGRAVYEGALERCRELDVPVLCAEVNTLPPNPASLAFHERLGFESIERRRPYAPDAEVVMLERRVR